jgi:hypothetical protein
LCNGRFFSKQLYAQCSDISIEQIDVESPGVQQYGAEDKGNGAGSARGK